MSYRMTSARRAALRKAQIASARKRKGRGKAPVRKNRVRAVAAASKSTVRRRSTVVKSSKGKARTKTRNRKIAKRTAIAVGAVGAAVIYKNREKWLVEPYNLAEHRISARRAGYSKAQVNEIVRQEKINHRHRSTFRARQFSRVVASYRGHHGIHNPNNRQFGSWEENYESMYGREFVDMYYLSRNARARHRLNRIKGNKTKGFDYWSGKRRKVVRDGNRRQVKVRWF